MDWAAGERGVLSAVIEMQVRIGDRHHVVGVDPTCAKQLRQVADDRPVLLLDLRAAEADPRVEEQHSVGMDYRVSHHGTRASGERAAIGVHEVGDLECFDPNGRPTDEVGHAPMVMAARRIVGWTIRASRCARQAFTRC